MNLKISLVQKLYYQIISAFTQLYYKNDQSELVKLVRLVGKPAKQLALSHNLAFSRQFDPIGSKNGKPLYRFNLRPINLGFKNLKHNQLYSFDVSAYQEGYQDIRVAPARLVQLKDFYKDLASRLIHHVPICKKLTEQEFLDVASTINKE